eukprot:15000256-Ditylum_brightwellii.AAC.1
MESLGAADIAQQMMNGKMNTFLDEIIIDDDAATMKALQRKEDGGLLSNDSSIASKLADLNHRTRVKRSFTYWIRWHKQQGASMDEIYRTRMAPLLYHFGDHNMCTPKCPAQQATERNEVYVSHKKFLCCKIHSDSFEDVAAVISRFAAI